MAYIANSVFSAGGAKYRPGDNVPEIENAQKFLELGFIISDGIIEAESEAPKSEETEEENADNPDDGGKNAENSRKKAKKAERK